MLLLLAGSGFVLGLCLGYGAGIATPGVIRVIRSKVFGVAATVKADVKTVETDVKKL